MAATRELGSNEMSGAEAMVRALEAHGVTHIFGLCGDTSLPFYDALARLDHPMQHILTRDERHAAYMAEWLKCLKEDSRAIFRASSLATKAVDFLNDLQSTQERKAA